MKISLKKLSQKGFFHLGTILPLLLVMVTVGGVGAYVFLKSSHAQTPVTGSSGSGASCAISGTSSVRAGTTVNLSLTITNTGTKVSSFKPKFTETKLVKDTTNKTMASSSSQFMLGAVTSGHSVSQVLAINPTTALKNGGAQSIRVVVNNADATNPSYSCSKNLSIL